MTEGWEAFGPWKEKGEAGKVGKEGRKETKEKSKGRDYWGRIESQECFKTGSVTLKKKKKGHGEEKKEVLFAHCSFTQDTQPQVSHGATEYAALKFYRGALWVTPAES